MDNYSPFSYRLIIYKFLFNYSDTLIITLNSDFNRNFLILTDCLLRDLITKLILGRNIECLLVEDDKSLFIGFGE